MICQIWTTKMYLINLFFWSCSLFFETIPYHLIMIIIVYISDNFFQNTYIEGGIVKFKDKILLWVMIHLTKLLSRKSTNFYPLQQYMCAHQSGIFLFFKYIFSNLLNKTICIVIILFASFTNKANKNIC